MTILEMTIVVLVLLSMIAICFVGATAWKRGADKNNNILNLRNIQQAVRGHQNLYGLNPGSSPINSADLFLSTTNDIGYLPEPKPPGGTGVTAYTYLPVVPNYGELYVGNVSSMNQQYVPAPSLYSSW